MFIGIDLGTSNSSLAVFDGDSVVVVPNSLGENLTPSVVRMDARGADAIKVASLDSATVKAPKGGTSRVPIRPIAESSARNATF